ncbi:MAG: imidazole glycerol phosphate synthase subunit HisH, partial [Gemmatimonadetes bacterium]|nr:imidazole glycerol phosphate synthase subunit HisH [Gemmatimonadota bacterium]
MGWNDVVPTRPDDPLFDGLPTLTAYYANSFICEPNAADAVVALTEYEDERLVAAVRRGQTWGVQFHPEKSSAPGGRLIANFLRAAGSAS